MRLGPIPNLEAVAEGYERQVNPPGRAWLIKVVSQPPSDRVVSTEILTSEDPQARESLSWWEARQKQLTEQLCSSKIWKSFHSFSLRSFEVIKPILVWTQSKSWLKIRLPQATCLTGPWWPHNVAQACNAELLLWPIILTVVSDEAITKPCPIAHYNHIKHYEPYHHDQFRSSEHAFWTK